MVPHHDRPLVEIQSDDLALHVPSDETLQIHTVSRTEHERRRAKQDAHEDEELAEGRLGASEKGAVGFPESRKEGHRPDWRGERAEELVLERWERNLRSLRE